SRLDAADAVEGERDPAVVLVRPAEAWDGRGLRDRGDDFTLPAVERRGDGVGFRRDRFEEDLSPVRRGEARCDARREAASLSLLVDDGRAEPRFERSANGRGERYVG